MGWGMTISNETSNDNKALLKRAYLRIKELERSQKEIERRVHNEPIAIVGIGCRLPGGVNSPEDFWEFLLEGKDAVREIPQDRWDANAIYNPDPDVRGRTYSRHGSFLDEIDKFDPQHFGISPREALAMDPQQRLLLEVAWESLENAGQNPLGLTGSKTGVFVGIWGNDYSVLQTSPDLINLDMYFGSGNSHSVASGRISYVFGLEGPCISLDTACSSSLLAAHLACQSLRRKECNLALAGGVNLILSPDAMIISTNGRMISRDGRCKTFDVLADGYGRGEGCAVVVLKRLSDAVAGNDHIYAVIRGSATNHDGRSNGLTAPSARAQESVIRSALLDANVSGDRIHYIEAHGTGTNLGDPIEIQALGEIFDTTHTEPNPLIIGTAKTSIGHLEAAAGITGLIKTALMLHHREIPPHLHLNNPNPLINWKKHPFLIPLERMPWPERQEPNMAGISSFGFSGTNVHMILEETNQVQSEEKTAERPLHLFCLSASHEESLQGYAQKLQSCLASRPENSLGDICYTANTSRSQSPKRMSVVVKDMDQLQDKLRGFCVGDTMPGLSIGTADTEAEPEIVFVFTGQGAQYTGMGRELYETQPVFRETLDKCSELLKPYLEKPLLSVIYHSDKDGELLDQTAYTQPALFAVEYALSKMWQSWGITPSAVMGHGIGEYVAACVAGAFSLEDGLKLIATRGRMIQQLPPNGAMFAVFTEEAVVRQIVGQDHGKISIAAVNNHTNTVLSGELTEIKKVETRLKESGLKTHQLKVTHAIHSPLMDPILDSFENFADGIQFNELQIPLVSNVHGRFFDAGENPDSKYLRTHLRKTVRFHASVRTLYDSGYSTFLEIGPNPTLLSMIKEILPSHENNLHPSLRRGKSDWQQILETLGVLYVKGMNPNWEAFDGNHLRNESVCPPILSKKRNIGPQAQPREGLIEWNTPTGLPPNRNGIRCWAKKSIRR